MATAEQERTRRLSAALREGERVSPLELFFDLVFVLAITQCTALMAHDATWEGLSQGMLVLGVLWWSWTGYAWLTSVVDPEEDAVALLERAPQVRVDVFAEACRDLAAGRFGLGLGAADVGRHEPRTR